MHTASLTKGYGGNPPSGRSVSPPTDRPVFLCPDGASRIPPLSEPFRPSLSPFLRPLLRPASPEAQSPVSQAPVPPGARPPPRSGTLPPPGIATPEDRHTGRDRARDCARPRLSDPYGGADKHVNLRENLRRLLVKVYTRRVEGHLDHDQVPKHIGVIVDGNRRWAKAAGSTTAQGHRAGADKIEEFLGWCSETDVEVVTLWLLSTDNLTRPQAELAPLLGIIENVVTSLAADGRWRVHHVGNLDLLPGQMQTQIKEAQESTAHVKGGILVNVAIAYGGRQEIADAVRSMMLDAHDKGTSLADLAENVDIDLIGKHLYTSDQPDPDLVIRTSGEQRLSGFMLWQTAHSEYYFCEVFWPAFRKVDFLRALRDYAARHRRYGN